MSQQYLKTNNYQDNSTDKFWFQYFADTGSGMNAQKTTQDTKQERDDTDRPKRKSKAAQLVIARTSKRNTDSEGVNTISYSHYQLCLEL